MKSSMRELARAVMSIQAVKAVEIGTGVTNAGSYGSEVQDEIRYDAARKRFDRSSNRAGGLEGGITNGQDVVVRGYLKPISTLRRALLTADMNTKEAVKAAYERSDVCVVPAGGVAGEAMVALTLAARCSKNSAEIRSKKRAGISTAISGNWTAFRF